MNDQKLDKILTILTNQQQQNQQLLAQNQQLIQQQGQVFQAFSQLMQHNHQLPPVATNPSGPSLQIAVKKTAPALMIQPASYFSTPQRRSAWWGQLDENWKKVFKKIMRCAQMEDLYLETLFQTKRIAFNDYNLCKNNCKIKDLQGLSCLTNIIELHVPNLGLQTLKGVEHLSNLEIINANNNNLKTILQLAQNKKLRTAYLSLNNDLAYSDIKKLRNQNITVSFHRTY